MTDAREIADRAWYDAYLAEGNVPFCDAAEYARKNYETHVTDVCEFLRIDPHGEKAAKARQIIRDEKIDG